MSAYPLTKLPVDVASGINANRQPVPVDNGDMVTLLTELWRGSEAATLGILAKSTWPELSALTGTNGQWGRVVGPDAGTHTDPVAGGTVDNEGEYIWYASPGPGWKRVSGLARTLVHALNIGAGSANAVQATSDGSFSKTAYKALISVNFTATNTGAVTLSIDGETPRNLVTNTGDALTSGYIKTGMAALVMIDSNGDYRLFSYGDAAAIQAAAEAAQTAAEAARDAALAAVPAAFPADLAALAALDTSNVTTATVNDEALAVEYFLRDASGYTDEITAAAGEGYFIPSTHNALKVWAAPLHEKIIFTELASADPTNTTWSDDALAAAIAISQERMCLPIFIPPGRYKFQGNHDFGPIPIYGANQGTSTISNTTLEWHGSTGVFLRNNGGGRSFGGTGGCLKDVNIYKANGTVAGGVALELYSVSDEFRPGEWSMDNVIIAYAGSGLWETGFRIDGRNTNTPGSRGVRTVDIGYLRVAGCTETNKYIHIRQATHMCARNVNLDTGTGPGFPGTTFDDIWDNIEWRQRSGNIVVNHSGTVGVDTAHALFRGLTINVFQNNYRSVTGAAILDAGTITNAARNLRIIANGSDYAAAYMGTTQASITGDGTESKIVMDTEYEDRNSNYDNSTGRYTAQCAGRHDFSGGITMTGITSSHARADLFLKTFSSAGAAKLKRSAILHAYDGSVAGFKTIPFAFQGVIMDEDDYAELWIKVAGGTKVIGVYGGSDWYSSWQGRLAR
ncbi:hypothetical protein [Nitratireductor sp. StC3]|uniref:hypothetical protein n=1 Tax=Nitratireductor sp. StC3 TaxID=2126741 RepID=UPI000D0DF249|nr:hypothetical protein [Nitratireductor sp. StC3]PSM18211.1 hypothetical protein C7T96_10090 [Nitratireductor sp. StC3]